MICRLFKQRRPAELPVGIDVRSEMVRVATSELGNGERGSNNNGEHVARYAAAINRDAPLVWCAAFVYHCYIEACDKLNAVVRVKPTAGAKRLCKNIVAAGGSKVPFTEAQPGDVVLWHRGAANAWTGHVGILIGSNLTEQSFSTIEGNRGNFPSNVRAFNHINGEANLLGFYRPPVHLAREL